LFSPGYSLVDEEKDVHLLYHDISSLELVSLLILKISQNIELWDNYLRFLVYSIKTPQPLLLDHEIQHLTTLSEMFPNLSWLFSEKNYMRLKDIVKLNAFTVSSNFLDFNVKSTGETLENVSLDVKPIISSKEVRYNAIYKIASFVNHSCNPNIEIARPSFTSHITWVATKPIKKGDELLCAYIPPIPQENGGQKERRFLLYNTYNFVCKGDCEECQTDENFLEDREFKE